MLPSFCSLPLQCTDTICPLSVLVISQLVLELNLSCENVTFFGDVYIIFIHGRQLSSTCQAIVRLLSGSCHAALAVTGQSFGSFHAAVRQLSCSCRTVIMQQSVNKQLSSSCQTVVMQQSGSHNIVTILCIAPRCANLKRNQFFMYYTPQLLPPNMQMMIWGELLLGRMKDNFFYFSKGMRSARQNWAIKMCLRGGHQLNSDESLSNQVKALSKQILTKFS